LETFTPLLYRVSLLCFNKSHVPAIIAHTRTSEKDLGATAHEVLKEISTGHPKVFSTHVKDLCKTLESEAPTEKESNPPGAVDDLKACASFAKKFPKEVPLNSKDGRKLVQGLLNFALYGSPPKAAKHAVAIIMSSDNKKEMHAREILKKSIKNFDYGCDHWLTKLAALSQLVLLAQQECEDDIDTLVSIAVENVLLKGHPTTSEAEEEWMEIPDDDMVARTWALKILVNRLLSSSNEETLTATGAPIFKLLNRMVKDGGEHSKKNNTPLAHKNRQRLLAANFLLKLACQRRLDNQITPADFNELALVTHDKSLHVRKGFASRLMKYLGTNKLPTRYYTILFMFAHEPDAGLKEQLMTWLRSRRAAFAARKEIVLETSVFARLLSLIAHHPDFSSEEETLKQMSAFILYYLKCVATEDNLPLIYHMAGRVKTVRDGIDASGQTDENLYVLSDLAQALILAWEDQNGWSMQSWPGKQKLPGGIFRPLESHDRGQEIAQKHYIDKDFADELDPLVRKAIKSKKRKAGDGAEKPRKKAKSEKVGTKKERVAKTPRKKRGGDVYDDDDRDDNDVAPSSGPRRKSDRKSGVNKSYAEVSSDNDEVDAKAGAEEEEEDEDEDEALSEAEPSPSSPAQEDVEMHDEPEKTPAPQQQPEESAEESDLSEPEPDPEPEPEVEPEPAPKPPKKTSAKSKAATTTTKKSNGVATSSPAAVALPTRRQKAAETVVEEEGEEERTPVKPKQPKAAKPTRGAAAAKAKPTPKAKDAAEDATSSSPVANGSSTVRRSGRTRS
jgi:sister-chromatid-cohesion protein PDS5